MGLTPGLLPNDEGSTPLSPEDLDELIPAHLETRGELNQWEAVNISRASDWIGAARLGDVLSTQFLCRLHQRMFDQTWRWAGKYRRSDNNVSPFSWTEVPGLLRELVANIRTQYDSSEKGDDDLDDIAARFHHRVVLIHPWVNGNGRHARLATDALLVQWGRPVFSWGSRADLIAIGNSRKLYIAALRAADAGDFSPLSRFVRT